MSEIKLGVWARDVLTGFEGHVTSRHITYSGCTQWGLQPYSKDPEKAIDPMSFDTQSLEFVAVGMSDKVVTPQISPFDIGDEVRDKVTGFKGTIISEAVYINGCFHYIVMAKIAFLSGLLGFGGTSKNFESQRLEITDEKALAKKPVKIQAATASLVAAPVGASEATAATVPPGGPNRRISTRLD